MTKSPFLQVAIQAAREAEKILTYYFKKGVVAEFKDDYSPVTIADKKAEGIIIETIKKQFPDHGFLGEESGRSNSSSQYTWIIDPLDMTKNFMRGIPLFSTEIALQKGDDTIVAVSNEPAQHELMYAEKGTGAYLNDKKVGVSSMDSLAKAYISYGNLHDFEDTYLTGLHKLIKTTFGNRGFGDAWSYHLLAQGKVDIVIEKKVSIWDVAACILITEEAGGKVSDLSGAPITNQQTFSIAATNGKLHSKVLQYFK